MGILSVITFNFLFQGAQTRPVFAILKHTFQGIISLIDSDHLSEQGRYSGLQTWLGENSSSTAINGGKHATMYWDYINTWLCQRTSNWNSYRTGPTPWNNKLWECWTTSLPDTQGISWRTAGNAVCPHSPRIYHIYPNHRLQHKDEAWQQPNWDNFTLVSEEKWR